jgi:hypothetical protein
MRPVKHFTEDSIPGNLKVHIKHLHKGNSSRTKRHGKDYSTVAILYDKTSGKVVAEAQSYCSDKDLPNRAVGRMVAIGKALKNYFNSPLSDPF